MLTRYLPISELQSILSEDQLRNMAALMRRLDPTAITDPLSDRSFLSRLYDAYHGPELLHNRAHRRRLLEYLPDLELRDLSRTLSLSAEGSFAAVADRIISLPWGANEETRQFLRFFGYSDEYLPEPLAHVPTEEAIDPITPPLKVLHDYQASIFYRALEVLRAPNARFMLQMPTGSGKTRTAMELIAAFLNEYPGRNVLWLAHTEELCEQAAASFIEVWRHVGKVPVTLQRCWGNYKPTFSKISSSLIIAGFAKLHSLNKPNAPPPSADLIIVDEAHMVLAPTYAAVVDWAKAVGARIIGLSATPGRSRGGVDENSALAEFFNNQVIGIVPPNQEGVIDYLQGRGILARVEREPIYTNITFHLSREEWQKLEEELDYPHEFLKRVAENQERNRIIAEKLWELSQHTIQVLVFAASVEQSRILCALLLYRGISAAHIDGTTSTNTRRGVIAKFRRGEIRFLFNYQVLATGFDVPKIDTIFIARPTKSIVLYSQMIGRGLRGPASGGTHRVRLVDVLDNTIDYSSDLDEVYEYFNDYWK